MKRKTRLMVLSCAAVVVVLYLHASAREFFPSDLAGQWNAFSRTSMRAGNIAISQSRLRFENGMEIYLSPVSLRHGSSLAAGEDPLAELLRITSMYNPPKDSEPAWGRPGNYLSLFWRNTTPFERWMFRGEAHFRGQILFVTVLAGGGEPKKQVHPTGLRTDTGFVYVR
jgi:hypothetical protein